MDRAWRVVLLGPPSHNAEAVSNALTSAGLVVEQLVKSATVEIASAAGSPWAAAVVWCVDESSWALLGTISPDTARVAVLPSLDIAGYRRALALEAGVVANDTSAEIISAVIVAACRGEALLPLGVVASIIKPDRRVVRLSKSEYDVADRLVRGETVERIATDLHFSDRTVRRRVQAVYLKLGVSSRAQALALLPELLLDQRALNGSFETSTRL